MSRAATAFISLGSGRATRIFAARASPTRAILLLSVAARAASSSSSAAASSSSCEAHEMAPTKVTVADTRVANYALGSKVVPSDASSDAKPAQLLLYSDWWGSLSGLWVKRGREGR
jgi:hypothetical protein